MALLTQGSYVVNPLGNGWFQVIIKETVVSTEGRMVTLHAIDSMGLEYVQRVLLGKEVWNFDFLQYHSRERIPGFQIESLL